MSRVGTCVRCGAPITFTNYPASVVPGTRRHGARGMCRSCFHIVACVVRGVHNARGSRTEPPDEVVVDRICAGEQMPLTNRAERREAVRILTERGCSANDIARRLGMATRSVQRHRRHLRDEVAA